MAMELGKVIFIVIFTNIYMIAAIVFVCNNYTIIFRYMIQDERLGACVTSYKNHCNASDYVKCVAKAFKTIHEILSH